MVQAMPIHLVFDLLASVTSFALTLFVYRWRLQGAMQRVENAGLGYVVALLVGAAVGGYGLGTLNLWLSGTSQIARSIIGALAGSIAAVEMFKLLKGMHGSTGIIFVPAFCATAVVGRWGCFFSGLADETYGVATTLPWGVNFGDGVLRHPVQLYESFSMMLFLVVALVLIGMRQAWFMANGFYALVAFYAAQRFVWEFLKPYGAVLGPFNLFHLVCLALLAYAFAMIRRRDERPFT
jgi:phosphatidylglycerol---prolipoprotein diacylglyceryl transferase